MYILTKFYQGPAFGPLEIYCAFGTRHDNVGVLVILVGKRVFRVFRVGLEWPLI